jgi:hypothetical protein
MSRQTGLKAEFVEFIPERLEPGRLYISRRYSTASHLCCCGCGLKVVTPLNPAKWHLTESRGTVSLYPSIGNWSFPCKSHCWITEGRVQWAGAMSPEMIAAVQSRDRRDAEIFAQPAERFGFVRRKVGDIWTIVIRKLRQWLRW